MVDGQYVEAHPDSMETDSAKKARPTFRSASGRIVYGGGAITPDLHVEPDTITTAEQELRRTLTPKYTEYYQVVSSFAYEQKGKVARDFTVQPAWRDEIYRRLSAAGVMVDRRVYDAGAAEVDRLLEQRIARVAFGEAAERERSLRDDPQLRRSIEVLRRGTTQKDLFAIASASATPRR